MTTKAAILDMLIQQIQTANQNAVFAVEGRIRLLAIYTVSTGVDFRQKTSAVEI